MDRSSSPAAPGAVAIFAVALLTLLAFDPLNRIVGLDPATWDYMSVSLLDGRIPYRDIFLHKTPLAAFLGGAGAALADLLGFAPLDGAHFVFVALGALGPALLFALIVRRAPWVAAAAAAMWMLAVDQWLIASIEGVRPKVATTAFGLAALLAADRRKVATAGVFGALATLTWQPGVAFLAAASWSILRDTDAARVRDTLRLGFGAAIPTALLLAFLATVGALDDFFAQAVGFNLHYIDLHSRTPANTVAHLFKLLIQWNTVELLFMPACVVALATSKRLLPTSLLAASVAYLGLMFVNFQAWPDMILLAPIIGAVVGCGLFAALTANNVEGNVALVAVLSGCIAAAVPTSGRAHPPITYDEQAAFIDQMVEGLGSDDSILTVSYPELLIHTGRHSVWSWPYMWFGVDRFAEQTVGGFDAILGDLDRERPRLMVVARRWSGPRRRAFERWASEYYTRTETRQYPHTVRPIVIYKLRD